MRFSDIEIRDLLISTVALALMFSRFNLDVFPVTLFVVIFVFAAHEIFKEFPDLDIRPIFFKAFFWCNHCGGVANDKTCPHTGRDIENFSGTKIRKMLTGGKIPSSKLMRPEVARCILRHKHPFVD